MKIETTQKEDISDIARRVDNIELGIANIDHEVGELVNLLTSSENDAQNIPDRFYDLVLASVVRGLSLKTLYGFLITKHRFFLQANAANTQTLVLTYRAFDKARPLYFICLISD